MQTSLVSVIVPVYNGERYLRCALQSIFKQDYPSLEVIVVDDGSVDNSADIAQSYDGIRYIYQPNQGVTIARNTGISIARGEFVAFLDQDDMWTSNKLSVQIGYLHQNPCVGFVLSKARMFLETGAKVPSWLKEEYLVEDHVGFIPGTLVVRRGVLKEIGGFDSGFQIASDIDWFARALDASIPMHIIPDVLLHKRVHVGNLSFQEKVIQSELLKLFKASIRRKQSRNQATARHHKS